MKIFGTHDSATLAQFEQVRANAVDAALMADGHVGYVMPIGGVAAYRNQVSPVGVGFDIACIAAGARVVTGDGYFRAIEDIGPEDHPLGFSADDRREVLPHFGTLAKGDRETIRVSLQDGRALLLTSPKISECYGSGVHVGLRAGFETDARSTEPPAGHCDPV